MADSIQSSYAPKKKEAFNYTFLPIHVKEDGSVRPGVPAALTGMFESAKSGFSLPYDVYKGKASPYDYGRVLDMAGLLSFGSMPFPASKNELRMGMQFRRTNRSTPYNDVPWMQFADDEAKVSSYGKNLFTFDDAVDGVVDAGGKTFRRDLYRALKSDPDMFESSTGLPATRDNIKRVVDEANPDDIVNSAGLWDNPDLVQKVWDEILDKRNAVAIKTKDGAVVFDPAFVKAYRDGAAF